MSLFFPPKRRHVQARSYGWVAPGAWGPLGRIGASNDVESLEQSMQVIALRACADLICSLISELPIDVFSGAGKSKRPVATPGYLEDPAGDGYGRPDWLYKAFLSACLRGNDYGLILDTRGGDGTGSYPVQVDLQHPDRCRGRIESGRPLWTINGVSVDNPRDVWHQRAFPIPGVLLGLSPVSAHAQDLGLSLAMTSFGKDFFDNGANPGAVIRNTEKSIENETVARGIKRRFMESLRGREPVVLGKGWEYQTVPVNPEESQFLESRAFTGADVCHMFGPGMAEILGYAQPGSSLTYANVSDRSVHLLVYALNRWIRAGERWLSSMLPRPQTVRFDRDALLESTTLQRYQAHKLALDAKWKLPNEVRDDEDLQPIPGGDEVIDKTPSAQGLTDGGGSTDGGSQA